MTHWKPDWLRRSSGMAWAAAALLGLWLAIPCAALAQIGSARYSSIVVDSGSGQVLSAVAPDEPRHPASLTKMMTLYMIFEALRDHRIALSEVVPVSAHAASMEPSKLGLVPGSRLTVEQGILGLVTKSANDAAAALGELLGGDEDRFAQMMTLRARALGMSHTTFCNASGLPDPDQISTARDLAVLARHLVQDFPVQYGYFSVPGFVFRGQTIYNHDRMLISYPGADGLKTGYTEASGHNLVTSALHGQVRLIGVVLGAATNPERDIQMAALLNAGFTQEGAPDIGPDNTVRMRLAGMRSLIQRLPRFIATAEAAPYPYGGRHRPAASKPAPALAGFTMTTWNVQVGSFSNHVAAQRAAANAFHGASAGTVRITRAGRSWRVQLLGLTQQQAKLACARQHGGCMLLASAK